MPEGSRGLSAAKPFAMKMRTFNGIGRSYSWILVIFGVAVGFALILGLPRPSHRKIQDKSPRQWARLLTAHPTESKNAPPSMGPALVPHLIDEIQRSSNPFHRATGYAISSWLYDHVPVVLLAWVPEPIPANERRLNAIILLNQLGPLAHEAVPVLIPMLDDEEVTCSVVLALQAIGPGALSAVPKMLQLLREEPAPRLATAVANLAPDDPEVIRTLAEVSRNGPGDVRREAEAALRLCARKLVLSSAPQNRHTDSQSRFDSIQP